MIKEFLKKSFIFKFYRSWKQREYLNSRSKAIQSKGIQSINELSLAIPKEKADIFVDYGTLLGVIRNKQLISWDDDIDLGIIFKSDFSWQDLERLMVRKGFKKKHQFTYKGEITEQNYEREYVSVDFFKHYESERNSISYAYDRKEKIEYPSEASWDVMELKTPKISGLTTVAIGEYQIPVPVNSKEYLASVYGESWMIPNPKWKSGDGPATTKLVGEYSIAEFF